LLRTSYRLICLGKTRLLAATRTGGTLDHDHPGLLPCPGRWAGSDGSGRIEAFAPDQPVYLRASFVSPDKAKEYGLTTVRWGGTRTSRYNWKAQADNAGSDWFLPQRQGNALDDFDAANRRAGLASYLTVPMLPWVARGPKGGGFSREVWPPAQARVVRPRPRRRLPSRWHAHHRQRSARDIDPLHTRFSGGRPPSPPPGE